MAGRRSDRVASRRGAGNRRGLGSARIATTRIAGQRVTDETTLQVTEAVLCGSINKRIVRKLLALGVRAVGLSGQDGGTLIAQRARGENGEDLGFVGEIVAVDTRLIATLLSAGYLPVVAPLALARRADHAYNVNADFAAGESPRDYTLAPSCS